MDRGSWLWRVLFAAGGIAVYWLTYPSGLERPLWALYDITAVGVTCSLGGSLVGGLVRRTARRDDPARAAALLSIVAVGLGVEYQGWPFSGHLVAATVVGAIEAGDRRNPLWLRVAAFTPAIVLVLIRTFWPQTPRMAIDGYTVSGLLLGAAIGAIGLATAVRLAPAKPPA